MYNSSTMVDSLVGTASPMSANQQFKDDIASIYASYANEGVNILNLLKMITFSIPAMHPQILSILHTLIV